MLLGSVWRDERDKARKIKYSMKRYHFVLF